MSSLSLVLSFVMVCEVVCKYPNDPQYRHQKPYFDAIKVTQAWDVIHGTQQRVVTIAVIDEGMKSDHEDLQANAVSGYNFADDTTDTRDKDGHGTQVAGIAGAVTNNGKGIAGIANKVKLMPIVCDVDDLSSITQSIEYAVFKSVDVILFAATLQYSNKAIETALKKANRAGIPFVCAAGNDGADISAGGEDAYPCMYAKTLDNVICVAGTQGVTMNLYRESNYAPFVSVAAPSEVYATEWRGGYVKSEGTSMSAAVIAGVVALMKSASPSRLTAKQVKSITINTSRPGVKKQSRTMPFGRVDVLEAVKSSMR